MPSDGRLTEDGLGKFIVSGLKAGMPDATNVQSKPKSPASHQATFNDDHNSAETQRSTVVVRPDAASAPPKPSRPAPRQATKNGDQSVCETQPTTVVAEPDAATGELKPMPHAPRQAAFNDDQTPIETHCTIVVANGVGAQSAIEIPMDNSPGAEPIADQGNSETHLFRVGGGGTTGSVQPTAALSRHSSSDDQRSHETQTVTVIGDGEAVIDPTPSECVPHHHPLAAAQGPSETHPARVGGNGGGANDAMMSRHHPSSDDHITRETRDPCVIGGDEAKLLLKPTIQVSRHQPIAADHLSSETQAHAVGGDGDGTSGALEPNDVASRHQPLVDDQKVHENQSARVIGDGEATGRSQPPGRAPRHSLSDDQAQNDTQITPVVGEGDDRAQPSAEIHRADSPVIAQLTQAARLRRRWHKAEKSLILQGRALCRAWTAGDKTAANKLFDLARAGECDDQTLTIALTPFLPAIERFAAERESIEKDLRKLAKELPVWTSFGKGVKGLGELRLALVVGECGDIGSYRNPSCLWKRMGLAVIDGERQRRKTDPEEAKRNGYNSERRAMAYVLSSEMLKAQLRAPKDENRKRIEGEPTAIGPYGALYLERRTYELARDITKAHAHNRAARYMVKRLFRELYAAWRRT